MDDKLAEIERLKKFTEADSVRLTEKIWKHILSSNKNLTPVTNPEGLLLVALLVLVNLFL